MKDYEISREAMMLNPIESNLSLFFPHSEIDYTIQHTEATIREGLTNTLGSLCGSVRTLLLLLEENNIVNLLPEVALPQYFEVLDLITQDAVQSIEQVTQAQNVDGIRYLGSFTEFDCTVIQ